MKIALVTSSGGALWREEEAVVGRLAGALACIGDVEWLVAAGERFDARDRGAVRVRAFAGREADAGRRAALARIAFGWEEPRDVPGCSCSSALALRLELPALVEEDLVRTEGPDAPELYRHLAASAPELVVFAGLRSPSTVFGMRALAPGVHVALAPLARDEPLLGLRAYAEALGRAEAILTLTDTERLLVLSRLGGDRPERVRNVRFALRVHPLARATDPIHWDGKPIVVVPWSWTEGSSIDRLVEDAEWVAKEAPGAEIRLVALGFEAQPPSPHVTTRGTASRTDLWRWMSRALAVLDPQPARLLGRETLESLLYGVPILVHARGGASREHAEAGNGGLWYRTATELAAAIRVLSDPATRGALGEQGRKYAEERYGEPDAFVERVREAVST